MADDVVKIIRIETGGSEQTVKGLKEEINSLRDALLNTEKGSEEYKQILEQLIEDQKKLTEVMRAGQKEATAAEGSYNALVNQMAALKKVWRETTDEASRKELGKQIKDINDKLKGFDASIGDFRRNVGDYSNAITSSFGAMGGAAKGMVGPINGVKAAFTALSAHPIVAVLTALAALLINGLVKGFKSSEEATNKLKVAFSGFQVIGDAIKKLFKEIAEWVAELTEKMVALFEKLGWISPEVKKAMDERRKIAQDEIKLDDKVRENIKKNADLEKEAADLRAKAADKNKYTAQERLEFLNQALQKENEISQNEIDALQIEYNIAKAKLELDEDNAELKDKEAEAYAKLTRAQTAYAQKVEASNKAISKTRKEMVRDAQAAETALLNLQKDLIKQEYDLAEDGSDEQLRLAKELRKKTYEIQVAGFKEKLKNRKDYENAVKMASQALNNDLARLEYEAFQKRIDAEKRQGEIRRKYMREGSLEQIRDRIGELKKEIEQYNNVLKGIEIGAYVPFGPEQVTQLRESLANAQKELRDFEDDEVKELERVTELSNQIILGSVKPMSAYYTKQAEMFKEYHDTMKKLNNEEEEDYKNRKAEAWKKYLDALINEYQAASNELRILENMQDDTNVMSLWLRGTIDDLKSEVENARGQLAVVFDRIGSYVAADMDHIQEVLMQKYQDNPLYTSYFDGLVPNEETINAIITKNKDALSEIFKNTMNLDDEELEEYVSDNNITRLFNNMFEQLSVNGLIPQELMDTYLENLRGTVDAEKALLKERISNWSSLASGIGSIMSSVADIYEEDLKAQVEHGEKSEKQAEEEFENIKALRIAVAVIDTIQGALAAFMGWQDKGQPWGAIIGAVQAAAVTAAGIAQIAQISNTKFGGGSHVSAGSTMMAQVTPVFTDYQPEQVGVLTGQQEAEELANAITSKPIRAYITESEVSSAQELARVRNSESTW